MSTNLRTVNAKKVNTSAGVFYVFRASELKDGAKGQTKTGDVCDQAKLSSKNNETQMKESDSKVHNHTSTSKKPEKTDGEASQDVISNKPLVDITEQPGIFSKSICRRSRKRVSKYDVVNGIPVSIGPRKVHGRHCLGRILYDIHRQEEVYSELRHQEKIDLLKHLIS